MSLAVDRCAVTLADALPAFPELAEAFFLGERGILSFTVSREVTSTFSASSVAVSRAAALLGALCVTAAEGLRVGPAAFVEAFASTAPSLALALALAPTRAVLLTDDASLVVPLPASGLARFLGDLVAGLG